MDTEVAWPSLSLLVRPSWSGAPHRRGGRLQPPERFEHQGGSPSSSER